MSVMFDYFSLVGPKWTFSIILTQNYSLPGGPRNTPIGRPPNLVCFRFGLSELICWEIFDLITERKAYFYLFNLCLNLISLMNLHQMKMGLYKLKILIDNTLNTFWIPNSVIIIEHHISLQFFVRKYDNL